MHSPITLRAVARAATEALIEQRPLSVRHEPGWSRDGFPLPMKRQPAAEDGSVTQDYRPLAILEFVQEELSGENAARRARDKKAAKATPAAA